MRSHFAAMTLLLIGGCSAATFEHPVPSTNILMVNSRGAIVDPTGNVNCSGGRDKPCNGAHSNRRLYHALSNFESEKYVADMTAALADYAKQGHRRRILIYIHGGLNSPQGTIGRAVRLSNSIRESDYYPIFINWQSSLLSSYWEHIWYVRQGEHWGYNPISMGLAPFYFGSDVARAVVKAPVAHFQMIRSDMEGRPSSARSAMAKEEAQRLTSTYRRDRDGHHAASIAIRQGEDRRRPKEFFRAGVGYVLTLPTKLLSVPIIDGVGSSAWETLIRRSRVIFHTDEEMSISRVHFRALDPQFPGELVPLGGGSMLLRHLQLFINEQAAVGIDWEITIVAHSMGAIVANEIIESYSDLPITNIVYMAAATSLRDYENTIFPYLRQKNCHDAGCTDRVKMYHLTLHRAAEVRDTVSKLGIGIFDLAPRGSLLVWIDNYLSHPNVPLDRTAGRFVNLMTEVHNVPKDLFKSIHIREFDVGSDASRLQPQKHGDFGSIRFWDEKCWRPATSYDDGYCYNISRE